MRVLLTFAALVLAASVARAQVDPAEDEDFSNSAFVRIAEEDVADLYSGDKRASDGDAAAAVAAWQRVLDRDADGVVEIGPRLYGPGAEAVRMRLARAADPVRAEYARLFGPRAAAAVKGAIRHRDGRALLSIARRFPTTPAATQALRSALGFAAEENDASGVGAALDELFAVPSALAPADLARAIATFVRAGDDRALRSIERRAGAALDASTDVGGAPAPLRGLLADGLARCAADHAAANDAAAAMARGNLQLEVLGVWDGLEDEPAQEPDDPRGQIPLRLSAHAACISHGTLFALGQRALASFDLASGRPGRVTLEGALGFDANHSPVADRVLAPVGVGERLWFTLTPTQTIISAERRDLQRSLLVGVDLATREVVTHVDTTDASFGDNAGWILEGPPARFGSLLLCSASRLGQNTECALLAFDASTGELRWSRFLASAARATAYLKRNQQVDALRQPPGPVVVAGGTAFVVTNLGIIAAVDAASGAVRWLFKYKRVLPEESDKFKAEGIFDTGGWSRAEPAVMGDRVVFTPEDSRFLYVLARRPSGDGQILMDARFKRELDGLLLADPESDRMFFAAREYGTRGSDAQRLTMIDVDGKRVLDKLRFEPEERICGRPALVGRTLIVPTNKRLCLYDLDRDLLMFDEVYAPADPFRVGRRTMFGNLTWDGGKLYSTSAALILRVAPKR